MALRIVPGRGCAHLAATTAQCLHLEAEACSVEQFPDGELRPCVGDLRDDDVYVLQSTGPPVNEHLVELLLFLDACRRAGAGRVTAVAPYFGYARQDRRDRAGEAIGARTTADAISAAGADRLVIVDPHTSMLESMFAIPVETLTAVPTLVSTLAGTVSEGTVVVAPDLGAVKLAERAAARLHAPVAVVRKARISGTSVRTSGLLGDVADRPVLIVDDMISTGVTLEAAVQVLLAHGAAGDMTVAATHALLVGDAAKRLAALPLRRVVVTDTLSQGTDPPPWLEVRSVASVLADAVGRLRRD